MRLDVHAFALARTGTDASEDAWAVAVEEGRLAVADGASSSWRAGAWAEALVAAWVARPPRRARGSVADGLARWLGTVRTTFDDAGGPGPDGTERAWFTEAAAARGAHAALLGAVVTGLGGRRPRVTAVAVGDVCLMVVRDGHLEVSFPVDDPAAFGARPALVSSLEDADPTEDEVGTLEVGLRPGDALLVASDAMAAFLLRAAREHAELWDVVVRADEGALDELVAQGVASGLCERDDLTLVRAVLVADDGAA